MTVVGRPRRAFVLAFLAACGAGASASTATRTTPRQEPGAPDQLEDTAPREAADDEHTRSRPSASGSTCLVVSPSRFIGFSEGMSLDDFDLAATEAGHVMALAEHALCQQASALEPSGRLATDLAAHRLTLFEVLFVRDDASAADVGLRRVDAPSGDARGDYRVAAERSADRGWQLVGVTLP